MRFGPPSWFDDLVETLELEDALLLLAIVLLPWAFGGVEIWAYRSASMLIAIAAAVALKRDGWSGLGLGKGSVWILPAFLLGIWAVAQVVPLPSPVIGVLNPSAEKVYRETFPGYPGSPPADLMGTLGAEAIELVPEAEGRPSPSRTDEFFGSEVAGRWSGWRTISLLPVAGFERIAWYFTLLLAFLLVRERTRDLMRAEYYRTFFFGGFVALALFGIVYAATSNGALYWVREIRQESRPIGPYVNPVNFAAVMEMAVPWLAAYAWVVARRSGGGLRGFLRNPIFGAGALVCLVAALVAASKAAAALLAVSLAVLLFAAVRGLRARLAIIAVIVVLAAGATVTLRETRLAERLQQLIDTTGGDLSNVDRLVVLKSSMPMLRAFPVAGSGFGSFREVFGGYLPRGEFLVWQQAHNDYLELLIEGGLIAGVLVVWLTIAFWFRVLRRSAWMPSRNFDLEHLGLILAVASLSLHAFVDFNHQIPANALLFVSLSGFLVARSEWNRAAVLAADGHPPVEET